LLFLRFLEFQIREIPIARKAKGDDIIASVGADIEAGGGERPSERR
jgi:hypothetical protein